MKNEERADLGGKYLNLFSEKPTDAALTKHITNLR